MTEPLTPEQARDVVAFAEAFVNGDVGSYSYPAWIGVIQKLLPFASAYADQSARLSAYEKAVGDVLWLLVQIENDFPEIKDDFRDATGWEAKVARLRALQEKNNE